MSRTVFAGLTLAWLASCGPGDGGTPAEDASPAYVGGARCAECHETEARLWTGSHHDLAMQEATEETVLGDFDEATFTYGDVTSTFYRKDGRFFVRTDGPDGTLVDYPIAYTFGATPLQQYLVSFPGGRYQPLAIAWDARPEEDGGARWFHLYPAEAVDASSPIHWTKPAQNWNTVCAACHSTHLEEGFDAASLTFETTWSELDVSCEACHGPGSRHVALAKADDAEEAESTGWGLTTSLRGAGRSWGWSPEATTASLRLAPGGTPSDEEIESCAPCHARRAAVGARPEPGARFLDGYRPSLLRAGLYEPDGQIDGEVYVYGSFVQSKMYAAGVRCSDCHDPHTLRPKAEGNALCIRCHRADRYDGPEHYFHQAGSSGSECVACHMPTKTYMVVDPRRDHGMRIPRPDLSVTLGTPNACTACHTDRSDSWAADAVERWNGGPPDTPHFADVIAAGRDGDPGAYEALVALAADRGRPGIVRGTALSLLGRYPRSGVLDALGRGRGDPDPMVRLGAIEAMEDLPPQTALGVALPLLSDTVRAVRLGAARLLAAVPPGAVPPAQVPAIAAAIAEWEAARLADGGHSSAWDDLANSYLARGMAAEAEEALRTALSIDPQDLVALLNLADLQRALGRDDLAEETLTRAYVTYPDAAEVLHAMGLLLVRRGDVDGALAWLERAVAAGPENPRFPYVHAVALASRGDTARAVRVLETALSAHPFDSDLLTALVTYSERTGSTEAAARYAARLIEVRPEDPAVKELAARLDVARGR